MNWLNIELSTLRSEEYLGSDPVQRATWLNLLCYCADQENGGVIDGCGEWGSRKFLQLIGVTKDEAKDGCQLWFWRGSSIVVWAYPMSHEISVKAKREAGRKGGRPKKTNKDAGEKPYGYDSVNHKDKVSKREAETKGKVRKDNIKEDKVTEKKYNIDLLPAEAVSCVDKLVDSILSMSPYSKNLSPKEIKKTRFNWASDFDKTNRLDGVPWDDINKALDFAINDNFWKTNVMSGSKFREKFNTLFTKLNANPQLKQPTVEEFFKCN